MKRTSVLFVTNGHGEVAIAACVAAHLPAGIACDHLALVGEFEHSSAMRDVGPRRTMPSGGLVAMGNVKNILRDLGAGLVGHTLEQLRFLSAIRRTYAVAVAVGDAYALFMTLRAAAAATVYIGTAKSIYVAPYGRFERALLAKATTVFVRDEPTAADLRMHGIAARPGNVIVDLRDGEGSEPLDVPFPLRIAIFPGSRESAYADALALCGVVGEIASGDPRVGAVLSIAPSLETAKMMRMLERDGWDVAPSDHPRSPFTLVRNGRPMIFAWNGSIGAMLSGASLVLGQAGTANEAAAAAGVPVVAYERSRRLHWYRKRQIALLDGALSVLRGSSEHVAARIRELLDSPDERARMSAIGRERMGPPGAAAAIAREVVRACNC